MKSSKERITAIDDWLLKAITGGALVLTGVAVWALIARVAYALTSQAVHVSGMALSNASTPAWASTAASITSARYETAELTVEGLSGAARGWLAAEAAASGLLEIGLCIMVAWLGMQLLRGGPFVRSVTWAIGGAAILVVVSGLLLALFSAMARAQVAEFLGLGAPGDQEAPAVFVMAFNLGVIGWGLALAVVAAAFQIGERMQQDTRGLI